MEKARVMVVEDDPVMQAYIREFLKEFSYNITGIYSTGEDAVLAISQNNPDIILMDIELAGYLDGIETAERIKSTFECPIIYLSGRVDDSTFERSKMTDPFAFLIKPFKPRELVNSIEMALYKFQTDKIIKNNEQRVLTTFDSIGEGLIVTDKKAQIKMINPLAEKILGKNSSLIIGKNICDMIHVDNSEYQQLFNNLQFITKWPYGYNQSIEMNTYLEKAEGKELPVLININCYYNKDEVLDGYVIVIRDLSEQKKTEHQIERLSAAIQYYPVAVIITNELGIIEYTNPRFTAITGYDTQEVIGQSIEYFYKTDEKSKNLVLIKEAISKGIEWKSEILSYKKDDTPYWESIALSPILNEKGQIYSYVIIKEEITQRIKIQNKLEQNEKKYKDLFDKSPVALWLINFEQVFTYLKTLKSIKITDIKEYFYLNPTYLDQCIEKIHIIDINQSALDLVKWKDKENLDKKFITLFSRKNFDFFIDFFNSIFHQQFYSQEDLHIELDDNQEKILQLKWHATKDVINPLSNVLISTVDITEKIQTTNMLKNQTIQLRERVKEQTALYNINNIFNDRTISFDLALPYIVNEIQSAFQYPTNTSARITLDGNYYTTHDFKEWQYHFTKDIVTSTDIVGSIEIWADINKYPDGIAEEEKNFISVLCYQISRLFEARYQEELILKKLKYETVLSTISSRFLSTQNFKLNINNSLKDIGLTSNCDRAYIFKYTDDQKVMVNIFEWCNEGIEPKIDKLQNLSSESLPWWNERILQGKSILISNIEDMPEEASKEKELLLAQSITSLISLPFIVKDRIIGFIGFDHSSNKQYWNKDDETLLQLFTQILGSAWDRKQTSDLLLRNFTFTNEVLNSVSTLIMVIDMQGRIIKFNQYCEKVSGYKFEEIRTFQNLLKIHIPEEIPSVNEYYDNLKKGINQDELELMWRTKDRKLKIILWKSKIVKKNDVIDFIILNGTDITDVVRSEQMLIEKEQQYRSLVQNLTVGIFRSTGIDIGRFLQVNMAMVKILGFNTIEELLSINERDIYANPEERTEVIKEAVIKGSINKKEILFKKKDGSLIWIVLNATVIYDSLGNFKWIDGFMEDITEIRQLEQMLVHSQKMEAIGQLSAGIAHEINTPTQFVNDNIHFLKDAYASISKILKKYREVAALSENEPHCKSHVIEIKDLEEQEDLEFLIKEIPLAIDQSLEGVERVAKIVRAMKDFSHPGIDDIKSINLNQMIESTVTVARNEWKYCSEIEFDLDPENPFIDCYPGELNQTFLNIIINAAHAIIEKNGENSEEKGKITISTKLLDDFVEIRISDTGAGVPDSIKTKLFNPFFTTKEPGKGTGQGLAISHNVIVKKHNGEINFESTYGQGTTFIIKLPVHL